MKRILAATDGPIGGEPLLDVITHHQYGGDDDPGKRVELIEDLYRFVSSPSRSTGRSLWITETGWARDKVSIEAQAQHLRTTIAAASARDWWAKTFWYDSHGREDQAEWGLLAPDGAADAGQPRPAFHAYRDVIAMSGAPLPVPRDLAIRRAKVAYEAILGRQADPDGLAVHARVVRRLDVRSLRRSALESGIHRPSSS
jgi:hypothetical protein